MPVEVISYYIADIIPSLMYERFVAKLVINVEESREYASDAVVASVTSSFICFYLIID